MVGGGAVGHVLVLVRLVAFVLGQLRPQRQLLPLLAAVARDPRDLLRLLGPVDVLQLERKKGRLSHTRAPRLIVSNRNAAVERSAQSFPVLRWSLTPQRVKGDDG